MHRRRNLSHLMRLLITETFHKVRLETMPEG
jgi:hypothetical protein